MSSTAYYLGADQQRSDLGLPARPAWMPPDITALPTRVEWAAGRGTGRTAVKPRESVLADTWTQVTRSGSEASWARLPDRVFEKLSNKMEASPEDLTFLADAATRNPAEAIAAIRVLGCIGEEGLAPERDVRGLLLDLLPNRSAAVRVAVVEAFWQMADRAALPKLREAAERETVAEVRRTLEHVIRVLG